MKFIILLFTAMVLCFPVLADNSEMDEDYRYSNLITLNTQEVRLVSEIFANACHQNMGISFDSDAAFPYFREFVWKCEREVLRTGSFPDSLSVKIFDQKLASLVGTLGAGQTKYSDLAIDLLRLAWQDEIKESMSDLFYHGSSYTIDRENINPIFARAENVYVLSSVLAALLTEPHGSLAARGVEQPIFLSDKTDERNMIKRRIFPSESEQAASVPDSTEERVQFSQAMALSVFSVLLVFNLAVFMALFFWVYLQRSKRTLHTKKS